jgi:FAD/FMN-containing dehydrogenase
LSGHATTAGMGGLSRKYGFALDAIVGAEVVTANGDILDVDVEKNADLFWMSQSLWRLSTNLNHSMYRPLWTRPFAARPHRLP